MGDIFRLFVLFVAACAVNAYSHKPLGSVKQDLTADEKALIAYEFSKDPNATMYSVFIKEYNLNYESWKNDPDRFLKMPDQVLQWVRLVLIEIISDVKYAGAWMFSAIIEPLKGIRDVRHFFKELVNGFRMLVKMVCKDWRRGLLNFFGGLLFLISHHSVEFTAQTVLVLAVGFEIISPLGDLIKTSVEASGASGVTAVAVKRFSVTFFMVLHAIDDPLIIFSSVLPAITASNQKLNQISDPLIAKKFVKQEILGLDYPVTFSNISKEEFLKAYTSFIAFICNNTTQTLRYNNETINFSDECLIKRY